MVFSFCTVASTLSLANKTHIVHDPRFPRCFPPPPTPRLQPLSKPDCERALEVFLARLPNPGRPFLTHDPDKAHLPGYILAPAIAMYGDCMFGADSPVGQDARIDAQTLLYKANVLMNNCVGKAEYDGGQSQMRIPRSANYITIDFQYRVSLTNGTENGVGNFTEDSGLVLSPSTAAALPVLSAFPDSAMVARGWEG